MKGSTREKVLAILAGGKATRFSGIEKARLEIGGKTILERILDSLASPKVFDTVYLLIGDKSEEDFKPLPEIPVKMFFLKDKIPGEGPLGGLLTVFEFSKNSHVFLSAGDMPFPSRDLMIKLYESITEGYLISVAESKKGVEPLFGWYSSDLYKDVFEAVMRKDLKVVTIFNEKNVHVLPLSETEKICDPEVCFFNINTKADYELAKNLAKVMPDRGLNENL